MKLLRFLSLHLLLALNIPFAFAQDSASDTLIAQDYFVRASVLADSAKFQDAASYYKLASEIYERNNYWAKFLVSETARAKCFFNQRQYDPALAILLPAIEESMQNNPEIMEELALAYYDAGYYNYFKYEIENTLMYWEKVLQIRKEQFGERNYSVSNMYGNIGLIHINMQNYDTGFEYLNTALQIMIELFGIHTNEVVRSYNNLANTYMIVGEYDLALEYVKKAIAANDGIPEGQKSSYLASYGILGSIYQTIGDYENSIKAYTKIFHLSEFPDEIEARQSAYIYNNAGIAYWRNGEYSLAMEYLNKALPIKMRLFGERHPEIATIYTNIGLVYWSSQELDKALEYFLEAMQIQHEQLGENHTDLAQVYNNIASVYNQQGEPERAMEYNNKALAIRKEVLGEKHPLIADSYTNLGTNYQARSYYDSAVFFQLEAINIYREFFGEKHFAMARNYNSLGDIYKQKSEYKLALSYYQKAIVSSLGKFNDTLDVRHVPYIKEVLNWEILMQALFSKSVLFSYAHSKIDGIDAHSGLLISLDHFKACDSLINLVRQTITSKADKIALGERASEIYNEAIKLCLKLSELPASNKSGLYNELAFYFSEKNKSSVLLEALAGAEALKFAGIPDSLLEKEHKLQVEIVQYRKKLAEEANVQARESISDKLFETKRSYDDLISYIESSYPKYYDLKYNREPASVKQIQGLLDPHTAMISYFVSDSSIISFILKRKAIEISRKPIHEDLAKSIRDFRYGLMYPSSSRYGKVYKELAYKLYQLLLPDDLGKKVTKLLIIPDAELCMIPFETLLSEEADDHEWEDLSYLIQNYSISYSYSANLFYTSFTDDQSPEIEVTNLVDWLAFAPIFSDDDKLGITMRTRQVLSEIDAKKTAENARRSTMLNGDFISPLPGTESEVRLIFDLYEDNDRKAIVQMKQHATEDFLKTNDLQKYRILHFATHGFVNAEEPELSGILLSQDSTSGEDGILFSGEIYNLHLNADLSVLSACETGLGELKKGEGLIGLSRALLYAGSKNIIVSLWKVGDESTSRLMIDFYKYFLASKKPGSDFSGALRQAKLDMIDISEFPHPYYWSPFILLGQ